MVDVQLDELQSSARATSGDPNDVVNTQSLQSFEELQPLVSTRSEVFRLIKEYMKLHGGAAGGASQAVKALTQISPKIEGPLAFQIFCDLVLKVDKTKLGLPEDPTFSILEMANRNASVNFWKAGEDKSCESQLLNLINRCRNWISVLSRKHSFEPTVASLETFVNLPLTDDMLKKINFSNTIETLLSQTTNPNVTSVIDKLVNKYPKAFGGTSKSQELPSQVSSMKLFGDSGALKLRSHKRSRDSADSPPSETNQASKQSSNAHSSDTSLEENNAEPLKKKSKPTKKVHWKPNHDLVQVRYFEMDGIARFKSAKNAKIQEQDEGSAMHPHLEWSIPKTIDFTGAFKEQLTPLMSARRGGTLEPKSEEAYIQETRESTIPGGILTESSQDSPNEPDASESSPDSVHKPRDGGKFVPATPPAEWLQKQAQLLNPTTMGLNPALALNNGMHMGNHGMAPMAPPMMPAFSWGMNFPMGMNMNMNMNMNMGIPPPQMSEWKGNIMTKHGNQ